MAPVLETLTAGKKAFDLVQKVRALVSRGIEEQHQQRTAALMQQVAVELGTGNIEEGVRQLEEFLQHGWAADLVNRGYRTVMDAVCEQATVPVATLVVEYLHRTKAPDRRCRRVGTFLADATVEDLQTAARVCKLVVEIDQRDPTHADDIVVAVDGEVGAVMAFVVVGPLLSDVERALDQFVGREELRDVLLMLVRHGFALLHMTGSSHWIKEMGAEVDEHISIPRGECLDSVRLLGLCLTSSSRPIDVPAEGQ